MTTLNNRAGLRITLSVYRLVTSDFGGKLIRSVKARASQTPK
jgi:hypothetical protein